MGSPSDSELRVRKRSKHLRHVLVRAASFLSFIHAPPKDLEGAIVWGVVKHLSRVVRIPSTRKVFYIDVVRSPAAISIDFSGAGLMLWDPPFGAEAKSVAYYLIAMNSQSNSVLLFRLKIVEAELFVEAKAFCVHIGRDHIAAAYHFQCDGMRFVLGDPDLANALRTGFAALLSE